MKTSLARILFGLIAFGVAFGFVEASVVVYLRALEAPLRAQHIPAPRDEIFPLLSAEQWQAAGRSYTVVMLTEVAREGATLVMLAGVPLVFARNRVQWLAGLMIGFGVWDIFYYVFLKLILSWPASLWTWDILFLLPVPWVGPVITPVLVAAWIVLLGIAILWREARGQPVAYSWAQTLGSCLAGAIIVLAFAWDFRNVAGGGWPNPFPWPIYWGGCLLGVVSSGAPLLRRGPAATVGCAVPDQG